MAAASNDYKLKIIKIIADNTGWRGADLVTAVAISLRESDLDPGAYNGNEKTGDHSWGLFQLNTIQNKAQGDLWKRFQAMGFTDPSQLADPAANARAAYALWQQSGWHAWLGYRPGLTIAKQQASATALVNQAAQAGLIGEVNARVASGPGKSVPIGSGGTGVTDYGSPASSSGGTLADTTRELYGYLATYLEDPELGPILTQASEENWSPARLQGAIEQTEWWKNNQAASRTWDANEKSDPATAQAQIEQRMNDIKQQASQAGFSIDPMHLHDMARDSLRLGWDQGQLQNAIGAEASRNNTLSTSTTMQQVRAQASEYAIPMSDQAMNKWGLDIATGVKTAEDYRQYLVGLAKGQYPALAAQLDAGQTMKQLADPFVQVAAQTLGISADTIDLRDVKWSGALNAVDSKGQLRPMTLDEWNRKLKTDPVYGWQNTADAHAQTYALGTTILRKFGQYAQ